MNYTIHQLLLFKTVAETLSITKAAERLFLTQPAVSLQLKKFQDQFDQPLTEVVGRQLYLTPFGKEVAQVANNVLMEVEELEVRKRRKKGSLVGTIRVSVVSTGKYIMPYLLSDFINQYPEVGLQLDATNKGAVIESLEKNEVDFSLVSILPSHLQIEKEPLLPNKLYLVGRSDSHLRNKMNDKKVFNTIPLIFREEGSGTRQTMESYLKKNELHIHPKFELSSNEAIKQAIIAGLGYSVLPIIGIKNELQRNELTIIPVRGFPLVSTWHMIWLKNKKFGPAASAFLKHIQTNKSTIIDHYFNWYKEREQKGSH